HMSSFAARLCIGLSPWMGWTGDSAKPRLAGLSPLGVNRGPIRKHLRHTAPVLHRHKTCLCNCPSASPAPRCASRRPKPSAVACPGHPLAVAFFGIVMAFNTMLFMLLHRSVLRHLLKPEMEGTQDPHVILKSWIGVASYLLGSASAWWLVMPLAYVFYALTPLFFIVPPSRRST